MTGRLLVDLAVDGRVTVSTLADAAGGLPEPGESFALDWSLDAAEVEHLRWYLEDYLRAPYGVYEQRGEWGGRGSPRCSSVVRVRPGERDRVIDVVVTETLNAAHSQPLDSKPADIEDHGSNH